MNPFLKCTSESCEKYERCKRNDGKGDGQDYGRVICNQDSKFIWFIDNGKKIAPKDTKTEKIEK